MKYRLTIDRQDGRKEIHEYPDKEWLYEDLDEGFHALRHGDTWRVEALVRQGDLFGVRDAMDLGDDE